MFGGQFCLNIKTLFDLMADLSFDQNCKDRLVVALHSWCTCWGLSFFLSKECDGNKPHRVAKGKINSELVKGWLNIKSSTNTFSATVQEGPMTFQIMFLSFRERRMNGQQSRHCHRESGPDTLSLSRLGFSESFLLRKHKLFRTYQ